MNQSPSFHLVSRLCRRLGGLGMGVVCCMILLFQFRSAMAADLAWATSFHDAHKLSTGNPIPIGTRFQIGIFIGGFIPTTANVAEWRDHWRCRGETSFVNLGDGLAGFSGLFSVEENAEPFAPGLQLYVWGFQQTSAATSEWFLATSSSWVMPEADPEAFPVYMDVTSATHVVLGSVDESAQSLTTSQVLTTICPNFPYADWLVQEFFQVERANPLIVSPGADPDGDGLVNAQEYTLGTSPRYSSLKQRFLLVQPASEGGRLQIPANPTASKLWSLQESDDLVIWDTKDDHVFYDGVNHMWEMQVGDLGQKRFWRLVFH